MAAGRASRRAKLPRIVMHDRGAHFCDRETHGKVQMENGHTAPTSPETADPDLAAALTSLLAAGVLATSIDHLDGADRDEARARRRALVVSGCNALAAAWEQPAAYDERQAGADLASAAAGLDWLSTRHGGSAGPLRSRPIDHDQNRTWLAKALTALGAAAAGGDGRPADAVRPLIRTVVRPLCDAVAGSLPAARLDARTHAALAAEIVRSAGQCADLEAGLVTLAIFVGASAEGCEDGVREAAAGLTRLVLSGPNRDDERFTVMTDTVASEAPHLAVSADGPYLFEGAAAVRDHLGVPVETGGRAAFCRCGLSATKPFCDGSHATSGFTGDKDARRVPDQRDVYVGQQATVFDNRGICAHSGFCTDRLNSVFHVGQEPFVTPSGGRLDDIMRAVRRCPSGALGFGIEGEEVPGYADEPRPPAIEISKDGPYRITGGVGLSGAEGAAVPRNAGASLEHYSLCRCGSSLNKPFCSGMHWSVGFADPRPPADWEPTLFEWAGGYPALLDMTRLFYSRHVPSDPVVGPLFATMEADHPERVAAWLSEVFGGPKYYSERYGGYTRMISQHLDKHLTQEQRSHWARLMAQSADEAGLPNDAEFRAAFMAYIEWGSRIAVENSTAGAKPPPNMPVPRWWWVCDATPNARVSALAPAGEAVPAAEVPVLGEGEKAGFAEHIKDLFRPMDRNSMKFAFDLWSFEDVHENADAILARLRAGTMPCDGAWAPEKIELLRRWIDDGRLP